MLAEADAPQFKDISPPPAKEEMLTAARVQSGPAIEPLKRSFSAMLLEIPVFNAVYAII
jgi:hypothetical protein